MSEHRPEQRRRRIGRAVDHVPGSSATLVAVALALATPALAGIGVPTFVWIVMLVLAAIAGIVGAARWREERAVTTPDPPRPAQSGIETVPTPLGPMAVTPLHKAVHGAAEGRRSKPEEGAASAQRPTGRSSSLGGLVKWLALITLATDFSLRPKLEEQLREGKRLHEQSHLIVGPTGQDIAGWEAEVKYLLRDDHEKLSLFLRDPDAATAPFTLGPDWRRLGQRLEQLQKVIALC